MVAIGQFIPRWSFWLLSSLVFGPGLVVEQ